MRLEAARSSKATVFGLRIGPNSDLAWRKSFWRVAKKKLKASKSSNIARFYYMYTNYFLSTGYKGELFSDHKIVSPVLGKLLLNHSS